MIVICDILLFTKVAQGGASFWYLLLNFDNNADIFPNDY